MWLSGPFAPPKTFLAGSTNFLIADTNDDRPVCITVTVNKQANEWVTLCLDNLAAVSHSILSGAEELNR